MTEGRRSADERVILVQPDHNADDIARVETLRRLGPRRVPKGRGSKDGLRQNRKAVTLEYRFPTGKSRTDCQTTKASATTPKFVLRHVGRNQSANSVRCAPTSRCRDQHRRIALVSKSCTGKMAAYR